jgi:N-acetylneuraminate synthase
MKNYIIAEIGINHNGSMELAKELIHIAKESGCDAVKFQKRDIESVYTKDELDAPRDSPWGTTNRQQKEGLEFSIEQYKELKLFVNLQ